MYFLFNLENLFFLSKIYAALKIMYHSSTQKAEADESLWVLGYPGALSEFQARQTTQHTETLSQRREMGE